LIDAVAMQSIAQSQERRDQSPERICAAADLKTKAIGPIVLSALGSWLLALD